MRSRVARVVLGASVIRVFAPGTKPGLLQTLEDIPVDELQQAVTTNFDEWYESQLEKVATEIPLKDRYFEVPLPAKLFKGEPAGDHVVMDRLLPELITLHTDCDLIHLSSKDPLNDSSCTRDSHDTRPTLDDCANGPRGRDRNRLRCGQS